MPQERLQAEFTADMERAVTNWYFNHYRTHWMVAGFREALASIPQVAPPFRMLAAVPGPQRTLHGMRRARCLCTLQASAKGAEVGLGSPDESKFGNEEELDESGPSPLGGSSSRTPGGGGGRELPGL